MRKLLLVALLLLAGPALAQKPPINGVAGPTTSAQLRDILTDETGTGAAFFAGGNFGAATGTSLALGGAPIGSYTLTGLGPFLFQNGLTQAYVDLFGTGANVPRGFVGSSGSATTPGTNALIGATEIGCPYTLCGALFPSGVVGFAALNSTAIGNNAYGISSVARNYAGPGTATNEVDAHNKSATAASTLLPPDTGSGTLEANVIGLIVNSGGDRDASIGIYVAQGLKDNLSGTTQFVNGQYFHPHASTSTQLYIGGDGTSTGNGLVVERGGAGSHIITQTKGLDSAGSYVLQHKNVGGSVVWGITQAGTANIQALATVTGAISGTGQTSASFNTAGALGGAIVLNDLGGGAGNGGAVVFGANGGSWKFGAIKGLATNGSDNSQGDIVISTRRVSTDATLTEAVRILAAGGTTLSDLTATGTVRANTAFSANGTAGASATVSVRKGDDSGACNLVFTMGLYTSTTC